MGREYPLGYDYFRGKLKNAFLKNREIDDAAIVSTLLKRGEYIEKELEALYMLKKYRTLKKRYYDSEEDKLKEFEKKYANEYQKNKN